MNISQFAAQTGISAHTLRYYERIGLLTGVSRNASGHREYSPRDGEWIGFISRLKATGMPLKQIRHYAQLRDEGQATVKERRRLLETHHAVLARRIREDQAHLHALQAKIDYYRTLPGLDLE